MNAGTVDPVGERRPASIGMPQIVSGPVIVGGFTLSLALQKSGGILLGNHQEP